MYKLQGKDAMSYFENVFVLIDMNFLMLQSFLELFWVIFYRSFGAVLCSS